MRLSKLKLVPTISGLLVAGFLITSLSSYLVSRSTLRREITTSSLPLTSDNVYSEIQRDVLRPVLVSSFMASDTFLRDWVLAGEVDEGEIRAYLHAIRRRYGAVTAFFVSERTRLYYHADGILKTVSPDAWRDEWYFRVRDMDADYEINVDPDMANADAPTIFVNYRLHGREGEYLGATGVGLTVEAVRALIETYEAKYERRVYFVSQDGTVRLAGRAFAADVTNVLEAGGYEALAGAMQPQAEVAVSYRRAGRRVHANVRHIPELDWYLVVEQTEGGARREALAALALSLVVSGVVTAAVVVAVGAAVRAYQRRIDTLRGIVPICSYCKKIRDDKGYWNQVEAYVAQHTEAEFSHGICPECMEEHFGQYLRGEDAVERETPLKE